MPFDWSAMMIDNYFGLLWNGSCVLALLGLVYGLKKMVKVLRGANKLNVLTAVLGGLFSGKISGLIIVWHSYSEASNWMMDISMSARYISGFICLYLLSLIIGALVGYILRRFSRPEAVICMALMTASLLVAHPIVYYWLQRAGII